MDNDRLRVNYDVFTSYQVRVVCCFSLSLLEFCWIWFVVRFC